MNLALTIRSVAVSLALVITNGVVSTQITSARPLNEVVEASRKTLVEATEEYKATSEQLLSIEENHVNELTRQVEQLQQLFSEGVIARVELEQTQQALTAALEKLAATQQQITAANHMIVEIMAAEELAKAQRSRSLTRPTASFSSTATIIRHTGLVNSVNNLPKINAFFSAQFGRSLPVSAHGQTPTHDRLGYDHRHAVDVALHPDSVEGRVLMEYLRSQGISFLAFRGAVPGVSTGPHIHIGRPSSRI